MDTFLLTSASYSLPLRGINGGPIGGTNRPCYGLLRRQGLCFSCLEGYRSRYNLRYKSSLLWSPALTKILFFRSGGVYLKVQSKVQTGPAMAVVPHHELYFIDPIEVQKRYKPSLLWPLYLLLNHFVLIQVGTLQY